MSFSRELVSMHWVLRQERKTTTTTKLTMGWKRGHVILKSEPYAHVLSKKYRLGRCSYCLQQQKSIKKCTGCSVLRYCSTGCQRRDWEIHRTECQCLQKVSPMTPTDNVLLMLRLVIRYLSGQDTGPEEDEPELRNFQQLMSHSEEIKEDADRREVFNQMCSTLSMMSGPFLQLPPPSELLDIFGKMVINTFTIFNQELLDIGAGLYLSPSCLDHRCSPNAVGLFNGKTLMVRAVNDIPVGGFSTVEQYVFLSYVDQMAPSWERQEQLQKQYYFLCQCPRCLDSSLDKAMTAVTTDPSDQDCGVGSQAVKAKAMESTDIKLCLTAIEKINQLKKTEGSSQEVLTLYRDSLWKVRFSLPASNIYKVRLLDGAFDAAISNSIWEEALAYGLQTLKPYRQFLPPCSPQLGMQLLRLAKLRLWLQRDHAEAYAHLIEAEKMITLTHGKDSELYGQLRKLLSQAASHQDPW